MAPHDINAILSLTDWRIQMAALYQRVSASDDLEQTWLDFVKERELALFYKIEPGLL